MPTGVKLTNETKKNVISCYLSKPMTIKTCAEETGLSSPTVIKILDEYNVERYRKSTIYNPYLDEHYFENIDCETKAYFLGLMITDGNVFKENSSSHRQASISITQHVNEAWLLQKFLCEVRANTDLGYDGRGACQAAIRSDIMAHDLEKYGVVPRKSYITCLPTISDKYMAHLIRGVLDGDGNITSTVTKAGKHKHAISFCGSHRLMDDLSMWLNMELHVTRPVIYDYKDRNLSEVKWQSIHDVKVLGDWMYEGATIYLKRKFDAFVDFKKHYNL